MGLSVGGGVRVTVGRWLCRLRRGCRCRAELYSPGASRHGRSSRTFMACSTAWSAPRRPRAARRSIPGRAREGGMAAELPQRVADHGILGQVAPGDNLVMDETLSAPAVNGLSCMVSPLGLSVASAAGPAKRQRSKQGRSAERATQCLAPGKSVWPHSIRPPFDSLLPRDQAGHPIHD